MIVQDTRVLFSGQNWPGANTIYIARAFEQNGVILRFLQDDAIWPDWQNIRSRIIRRLLIPVVQFEWNQQLLKISSLFKEDHSYFPVVRKTSLNFNLLERHD